MESSFKRFFTRRKSKGQGEQSRASSRNGSVFGRPSFSALSDARPSMAPSRGGDSFVSYDRLGSLRGYVSPSADDLNRPKTGSRIQPILIGISRPDAVERPGTAGSFRDAVLQAADSIGINGHPPLSPRRGVTKIDHRAGTARHVDIFAVAGTFPSYNKPHFNEDIATRNGDTLRWANGEPEEYIPSSRYQEEVAERNSNRSTGGRTSSDTARRSTETERANSLRSRPDRDLGSSLSNGSYTHHSSDFPASRSLGLQDSSAYHSRQYSQRPVVTSSQLSPITQETNGEHDQRSAGDAATGHRRQKSLPSVHPNTRMSIIPEHSTPSHSRPPSLQIPEIEHARPRESEAEQMGLTNGANLQAPLGKTTSRGSVVSDVGSDSVRFSGTSGRSARRPSLPNRTILDLTGEDNETFSETSSTYGYSQYSPVLEQAKSGKFETPSVPNRNSHQRGNSMSSILREELLRDKNPSLEVKDLGMATVNVENASPTLPTTSPTQSSFSPISTLASLAPRQSVYANRNEPMSMVQRVTAALEARQSSSITPPPPPSGASRGPSPGLAIAAMQPASRSTSSSHANAASPAPSGPRLISSTQILNPVEAPIKNRIKFPESASSNPVSTKPPPNDARQAGSVLGSTSGVSNPDRKFQSVETTSSEATAGVRTRDFALQPRKSASSLRKENQTLKRSALENAKKAAEPRVKTPKSETKRTASAAAKMLTSSSGWDEEAFARKQAEAKAALLRLQRSLNEDFMSLPPPPPISKPPTRSLSSQDVGDIDGSPLAPTAIFSNAKMSEQESVRSTPVRNSGDSKVLIQPKRTSAESTKSQVRRISGETAFSRDSFGRAPSSYRPTIVEPDRRSSTSSIRSRSGGRKPAPLRYVEPASKPIDATLLPPSLLAVMSQAKPPKSPGEISLSAFPLPNSRPTSEHESTEMIGMDAVMRPSSGRISGTGHDRANSMKSMSSVRSQYSIPYHIIPDRSSSVRDLGDG